MKNFIYTTLLVFATLFCQAFGAQYEPPTIFDTTICVRKGDTIKMYEYKEQILRLLESQEKERWSGCCDMVSVELKSVPGFYPEDIDGRQIRNINDWPVVIINGNSTFSLEVTYIRRLRCSDILKCKDDASSASLAMWHLFGKLVSGPGTGAVTKISDTAFISTEHKVYLKYQVGMSFPNLDFKIQGDSCFDKYPIVTLSVPKDYNVCQLKWIKPKDLDFIFETADTLSKVSLEAQTDDYLYPVICMAISCGSDTVFDTIQIGKPTLTPEMEELACVAANETSFKVAVKEPDAQLSYHWMVEDKESGDKIDSMQGANVNLRIPKNKSVKLRLVSTGGCRDAEMEPMILHRSLVSEAHHIEMESESLCIFEGDTLRFSLSEKPEDTLVWQIDNKVMLPPHDAYNYQALQAKDNVVVSVYAKSCPDNKITDTFNIREDFKVSLGTSPMCISVRDSNVIRLISNGINPEIHWYGNGVEIDSTKYSAKDSISLRLVNPGDQNLYVAVTAKECGKFSKDSISLRPKPEKPSLDTLWNKLTPCIPLGIADTIELRVQPQEGVNIEWSIQETTEFALITEPKGNSIWVRVNYGLFERNTPIPVSVYAYTDGCLDDSETLQDTLYAIGAGLGEEWDVIQQIEEEDGEIYGYTVGFSDDGLFVKDYGLIDPFDGAYLFDWSGGDFEFGNNTVFSDYYMIEDVDEPFDVFCKLTRKESQCYSVYSTTVGDVDMLNLQSVAPASRPDSKTGEKDDSESTQEKRLQENGETPCPGIALHPNPIHTGTQVKVEGICETESFTVECYSSQGSLMFRTTAKGDTFILPTDNYTAGVYIVKIQPQGKSFPIVKKLIIL